MSEENTNQPVQTEGPISDDYAPTPEAGYDLSEVSEGDPDLQNTHPASEAENANLPPSPGIDNSGVVEHQMITANLSGH